MFKPEDYILSAQLFLQLLGVIYFFAFSAFLFQIRGLIGKDGILPIEHYLANIAAYFNTKRFYIVPNVFWINASDAALYGVVAAGTILSVLLAFNIVPWLLLPLLFILYLSIVSVGQDFLSFGWEIFLLEITFNAIFLSWTPVPNVFIWMSLNLLLFRFHFQGGAVKLLSRDVNWRNLTACAFHYQSQPLPNTVAWYIYKAPMWFHKLSTLLMFIIELIAPFGIFVNSPEVRLAVFICFFGLQFFIWFTGNFSYLNHLTAALCIILVSDAYLSPLFGPVNISHPTPLWKEVILSIVGSALLLLQLMCLWNHFFKPIPIFQRCLSWVAPFHLVNRYGIFAVMTTKRYEIVVEGSDDEIEWKEYLFYHKASELSRRPRRVSPYQPRIDWQAWFLPFTDYDSEPWFQNFLYRLLTGSPAVLALLRKNPFPDKPPKYIRAVAYDYEFTTWEEKKETGNWWKRRYVQEYSPILSLKSSV